MTNHLENAVKQLEAARDSLNQLAKKMQFRNGDNDAPLKTKRGNLTQTGVTMMEKMFEQGFKNKEIADVFSISLSAVTQRRKIWKGMIDNAA